MKWDITGEENNSGSGGKRVENEMGYNGRGEQQWHWRERESRECNVIERERKTTVKMEGRE